MKAFACDILNVAQQMYLVTDERGNIVAKGENAGYQLFLLFHECFSNGSFLRVVPSFKTLYCIMKVT